MNNSIQINVIHGTYFDLLPREINEIILFNVKENIQFIVMLKNNFFGEILNDWSFWNRKSRKLLNTIKNLKMILVPEYLYNFNGKNFLSCLANYSKLLSYVDYYNKILTTYNNGKSFYLRYNLSSFSNLDLIPDMAEYIKIRIIEILTEEYYIEISSTVTLTLNNSKNDNNEKMYIVSIEVKSNEGIIMDIMTFVTNESNMFDIIFHIIFNGGSYSDINTI